MQTREEIIQQRALDEAIAIILDETTTDRMLKIIYQTAKGKLDEKRKGDTKFKVGQFVRIKHHSVSFNDKFRITKFMRKNYLVEKVGEKGSFRVSPSLLIPFNKKT